MASMDPITRARIAGQSGLLTRAQARASGLTERAIDWRLSSGRWTVLHPGVYLTAPGRDDWEMRAVAALLHAGTGAVLSGRSAGHVWGLVRAEPAPIEVSVPWTRIVRPPSGVVVTRGRHVTDRTHPTEWPHRTNAPHTVWDLAAKRDLDSTVTLAAKAIDLGIATTDALRLALADRPRQRHRAVLTEILAKVDEGAESPAEVRYLRDVERAHGLPRGTVQSPTGDGRRRDVEYEDLGVVVEIDGRLNHDGWQARKRDGRRDRKALASGRLTVRAYWTDLVPDACDLAADVGTILRERGWLGGPSPCRRKDCVIGGPSADVPNAA